VSFVSFACDSGHRGGGDSRCKVSAAVQSWWIRRSTNTKKNLSHTIPAIAVVLCLSIAAVEFYRVRELFAALAIFAVLFGTIGTALLILFLIQMAAVMGVNRLEMGIVRARVRHTAASVRAPRRI